jgi:NADH:ubiquinone oxidoreductase subunit H
MDHKKANSKAYFDSVHNWNGQLLLFQFLFFILEFAGISYFSSLYFGGWHNPNCRPYNISSEFNVVKKLKISKRLQ